MGRQLGLIAVRLERHALAHRPRLRRHARRRDRRESLGVDLLHYKAMAFALSGFYAGIAGGLYVALLDYVSPEGFDLFQMVMQKAMVVVGGLGSIVGSVLGAACWLSCSRSCAPSSRCRRSPSARSCWLRGVLPGWLVVSCAAAFPGWEEPLHAPPRADAAEPRAESRLPT